MPNRVDVPTLLVCSGKHCRKKRSDDYQALHRAVAATHIPIDTMGCIGSCSGPTVALDLEGTIHCFEKLRSKRSRADLIEYTIRSTTKPSKHLRDREITGKKRKKATARLNAH